MPPLDWWMAYDHVTTLRCHSVSSIGCQLLNESSANCACLSTSRSSVKRQSIWKTSWLPSPMFHRGQRFTKLWRGTFSYRGLASSSGRGRCSSALWKLFCSRRHTMFDFSAFTYRFYSQTVLVLFFFSMPDIAMRRRSICRRRTKSIVVFVICIFIWTASIPHCELPIPVGLCVPWTAL